MAGGDEHLHIGYFRHGEVALLLKPIDKKLSNALARRRRPHTQPELDQDTLNKLRAVFEEAGVPLLPGVQGTAPDPAITGADGRPRRVLPIKRDDLQVLQTVNLRSWIDFPVKEPDHNRLFQSMTDVANAVSMLNKQIAAHGPRPVGQYKLTAAAPNWLATRFNC